MILHNSPISGVAAFNNKWIATVSYDNKIILWDSKKKEALYCAFHDHLVNSCAFSSCGKFLITGSSDYTARLWKVPELLLLKVYIGHNDDVDMVSFSNDNQFIATVSHDNNLRVFNIDGTLVHTFKGHTDTVLSLDWSKNDDKIVTCGDDGTIRIWDIKKRKPSKIISFNGIQTDAIAISNNYIYAGNDKGDLLVINMDNESISKKTSHEAGIKAIKFNKSKTLLISASYDYHIKIWQTTNEDLTKLMDVSCPSSLWLRAVEWLNDTEIIFGTFGSSYATYNLSTKKWNLDKINSTEGINDIEIYNDEILSIGDSGKIKLNGKEKYNTGFLGNFIIQIGDQLYTGGLPGYVINSKANEVIYKNNSPLNCAVKYLNSNSIKCFIGTYNGDLLIFDFKDGKLHFTKKIKIQPNAIKSLVVQKDILFAVCANGDCSFYDINNLNLIKYIKSGHDQIANDNDRLGKSKFVSVGRDRKLIIWNENFIPSSYSTPHSHSIKCVATSTNEELIATGAYNGLICIYQKESNSWYKTRPTNSGISSIYYDDKSNIFIASSYDGNVYNITLD